MTQKGRHGSLQNLFYWPLSLVPFGRGYTLSSIHELLGLSRGH